ncbi:MAG: DoxX family protein [Devosia sp.]|nr:DoxX family protein [Devosia sp.]
MTIAAILIIIGRVVLGAFFVITGTRNFIHYGERRSPETNYGWPLPAPITALGFAMQLVGGLSVMLGVFTAWGAAAIIVFLVGATELFHNFLLFKGKERDPHLYFTLVNIALCGYCLLVIGTAV